jgi:hypothetical protein
MVHQDKSKSIVPSAIISSANIAGSPSLSPSPPPLAKKSSQDHTFRIVFVQYTQRRRTFVHDTSQDMT